MNHPTLPSRGPISRLLLALVFALGAAFVVAGCEDQGPAEDFGEDVDDAADDQRNDQRRWTEDNGGGPGS